MLAFPGKRGSQREVARPITYLGEALARRGPNHTVGNEL